MGDFRKLLVWQKAYAIELDVDRITARMRGRKGALRTQLVRAVNSISANIVEGSGQASPREYARYVRSAITSSKESEHHLLVARDTNAIGRIDADSVIAGVIEVRKMLHGLRRYLASLDPPPPSERPKPPRRKR